MRQNWEDTYELMAQVDTCVLGAGMYPDYEHLFKDVVGRHALEFMQSRSLPGGTIELSYRVEAAS
jgi:hypothetical protein